MFRVLVIGNNITRANLIARAIKDLKFGAKINYALSAVQAVLYLAGTKSAGKNLPDVIILSAQLPDTTGLEALQTLVEAVACDQIPVIVVSDSHQDSQQNKQEAAEYYKQGAGAYVAYTGEPTVFMSEMSDTICFVAMMQGLIPRQPKYFPPTQWADPTIADILQVYL